MPLYSTTIDREFAPKEAAEITGVSVALQRDWRRRKVLPEKKEAGWAKFKLADIIEMLVMKSFSEAGFSVLAVREVSSMAVLPTLRAILKFPDAVEFEGDEISEEEQEMMIVRHVQGGEGRYLLMAMDARSNEPQVARLSDLKYIEEYLADRGAVHCTIVDCERMAKTIVDRAGTPVMRIEIEAVEQQ